MTYLNKFFTIMLLLFLAGCGKENELKELARLPIKEISRQGFKTEETHLDLKKGEEVIFYTDLDVHYKDELVLGYLVEIKNGEESKGIIRLEAIEEAEFVEAVKSSVSDTIYRKLTKEIGSYEVEEDGNYLFRAALMSSPNFTLKIDKADLILKK
ncbi:hypothetical protein SAMN05216480_102197 [Pustulibacterium marinum]|uniref:Lipoprotein n=1 Tax=Pustulibacterium marinum TaxID=1224947 RepID=A0A1I7FSM5_9FLAO|nr:hypothetical protein [Pustulibacterium marinum]SFU39219.1 hypothetical protein SAMN05216480_102197 [Pustulibacterium marinum]